MAKTIQTIRQTRWMRAIHSLFMPRSQKLDEAFRERTMRFFILISFVFFTFMLLADTSRLGMQHLYWYGTVYAIGLAVLLALHSGRVQLASRIMVLSLVLIPLDNSVTYWSPGTIIFGLLFTFLFQMILKERRDTVIAVALNLILYTLIMLMTPHSSPLDKNDFFSNPIFALITVYVAHFLIIGVAHYIRQEQAQRNQIELLAEKQRADILRQFIGHASHDLRTPLSKLSTKLYLLEKKPENSLKNIADMRQYLGELDTMLSSMLEMLSLDEMQHFEVEATTLDDLLKTALELSAEAAAKKNLQLNYHCERDGLAIAANNIYFLRALGNILENAVNYSPESGVIAIRSHVEGKQVLIEIADSGAGIPPQQLPLIFDRFYRGDEARNQQTGFNGLGLAIAKKIIELHHGEITVKSEMGKGTSVCILMSLVA